MDLHRLGRVHVLLGHEPARLVGADRDEGDVEAAAQRRRLARREPFADVGEVFRVAGVAGEEEMQVGREHREAAPERLESVVQPAPRPVLHGGQHHLDRPRGAGDRVGLPPVELDHAVDAALRQPRLEAQRHDEERRSAGLRGQRADARVVEVVVVVVRDQHQIDVRQFGEREAGRDVALRPDEAERRRPLGEHRVGEDAQSAELRQHRRMADPGDRRLHRHRAGARIGVDEFEIGLDRRCRRGGWARRTRTGRIELPLQQRTQTFRLEVEVVVLKPVSAVVRRLWQVAGVGAVRPRRCERRDEPAAQHR